MGRIGRSVIGVLVVLAAACSGGGGSGRAGARSPTSTTTSTTAPTTSTTTVEDAVRDAWDGYWAMVVRLGGAPDGNDPELGQRAVEPLLSALRDDFTTQKSRGQTVVIPAGAKYAHRLESIVINGSTAELRGCKIDDSTTVGPSGEVVDDSVSTSTIAATFILEGGDWKAQRVEFSDQQSGVTGCADT